MISFDSRDRLPRRWLLHLFCFCYHPQSSCGKVMFLHLSVILFTGGVSARHPPRQAPTPPHPLPFSRRLLQRTVRILLECILVCLWWNYCNSTSTLTPMNNVKSITILVSLNFSQWNPSLSPLNVLRFQTAHRFLMNKYRFEIENNFLSSFHSYWSWH